MDREKSMFPSNARKMGILGGLALGLIALVLSVCCMSATSTVAYAGSQSSVGTPASSVDESGISTAAEANEATASFNVTGENNQNEARKILGMVNTARTQVAVGALTWDYDLEKAAMQRAAEIAILFSHDRPNGEQCFTAFPSGYTYCGENIHVATGESNAASANQAWTESQGHYENMVKSDFTCMAAAMFEVDGVTYWVELFANPNSGAAETAASNGEKTYQIDALPSNLDLSFYDGLPENAEKGSKAQYVVVNQNKGCENFVALATVAPNSFNWSSSNEGVASIDTNGLATVNGKGTVTITAKNKSLATVVVSEEITIDPESSSSGATQVKEGWVHGSKGWWYRYSDGSYATGWFYDGKNDYYFDDQGWMKTGWQKIEGDWYYFKGSGALTTGWQKVKGKWYFMDEVGIMLTGKITDAGKTYFLDNNGAMKTGWVQDGSNWYYTNKSGAMTTGWQKVKNKWYFMNAEGIMQTGKITDKGKTYFLADTGAMKTGWVKEGSDWYYCNNSGAMVTGWQKVKGTWYYLNDAGVMVSNDFRGIGGKYYHFEASGAMSTGWKHIDEAWYYFASSGAAKQNQWLKSGGKWYYFASDYRMCTGFIEVDGKTYYMSDSGAMVTGWKSIEDKWRYFSKSGDMQTSKWISGKYWVDADGIMATNAWVDGGKYWVDAEGKYDASKKPEAAAEVVTYAAGSNVYHTQKCRSVANITDPQTMTLAEAQAKGMTLCKNCESMSH